VPGFALRLLFGELADALLIKGQRVVPARSEELGFQYAYPDLASALSEIYLRARRA
jgi:NAD dependent epimerase/dehydratase family enzyme